MAFARVMKALVDDHFPKAETIRVVLDNLNTHVLGALYEAFSPEEAWRIATWLELEFPSTPKHGSWLNRAETEFSALTRQCLSRRIEMAEELAEPISTWERMRNAARTRIDWSFRIAHVCKKLHSVYPS